MDTKDCDRLAEIHLFKKRESDATRNPKSTGIGGE
jgi:hypothetical protein